jgi:hypothetical protein
MEYVDFEITVLANDAGFKACVRRFDRRQLTMAGTDHPHLFHRHVDTVVAYSTEEEAIENAKLNVEVARPETSWLVRQQVRMGLMYGGEP